MAIFCVIYTQNKIISTLNRLMAGIYGREYIPTSVLALLNDFPHISHVKDLPCLLMCVFKWSLTLKILLQMWHLEDTAVIHKNPSWKHNGRATKKLKKYIYFIRSGLICMSMCSAIVTKLFNFTPQHLRKPRGSLCSVR